MSADTAEKYILRKIKKYSASFGVKKKITITTSCKSLDGYGTITIYNRKGKKVASPRINEGNKNYLTGSNLPCIINIGF